MLQSTDTTKPSHNTQITQKKNLSEIPMRDFEIQKSIFSFVNEPFFQCKICNFSEILWDFKSLFKWQRKTRMPTFFYFWTSKEAYFPRIRSESCLASSTACGKCAEIAENRICLDICGLEGQHLAIADSNGVPDVTRLSNETK